MIETDFFFLSPEQYQQSLQDAAIEGVSIDYYLLEFTDVFGTDVVYNGEEWVEVDWINNSAKVSMN